MEKIPRNTNGFTLIEMVVTILIVSILAVFATSRLDLGAFQEAGFFQQSSAAIRYAQKLAISSNCSVRVQMDSSGCLLSWNVCGAVSGDSIVNPATGLNDFCANSAATVTPSADFSFDNIGRPVQTSDTDNLLPVQNFTVGSRTIRVEAETGYSHEP